MSNIKNGDMPSMPSSYKRATTKEESARYPRGTAPEFTFDEGCGLTKREQFAAMAMQGLLSNSVMGDSNIHESADDWKYEIASSAVEFADALLSELEK